MAPRLATTTIEQVGDMWRVCADGICKEHQQEWQAKVFYHQMISNPTVHADAGCQRECQDG
jgi:hypothetical protein